MIASNNECVLSKWLAISVVGSQNIAWAEWTRKSERMGNDRHVLRKSNRIACVTCKSGYFFITNRSALLFWNYSNTMEVLEIAGMGYASIDNGKSKQVLSGNHNEAYDWIVVGRRLSRIYRRAGFCLVTIVQINEHMFMVGVVFYCRGPQIRNEVVGTCSVIIILLIVFDRPSPFSGSSSVAAAIRCWKCFGEYTVVEKSKKTHVVKRGETLGQIAVRLRLHWQ